MRLLALFLAVLGLAVAEPLSPGGLEDAIKANKAVVGTASARNQGLICKYQAFFDLPIDAYATRDAVALQLLSQRIAEYEAEKGIPVDAKIATVKEAMKADGFADRAKFAELLDAKDATLLKRAHEARSTSQKRGGPLIVEIAEMAVGRVNSLNRGDGKKYGGALIDDFYKVAFGGKYSSGWTPWLYKANKFLSNSVGKKTGPWSWCGIFCVWAVRLATGNEDVYWAGGRSHGLEGPLRDIENAKPGDIILPKDKDPAKPLNHHCLLKEISTDGETYTTIDGNGMYQSITENERPKSTIRGYYRAVPASEDKAPATESAGASPPADAETPQPGSTDEPAHVAPDTHMSRDAGTLVFLFRDGTMRAAAGEIRDCVLEPQDGDKPQTLRLAPNAPATNDGTHHAKAGSHPPYVMIKVASLPATIKMRCTTVNGDFLGGQEVVVPGSQPVGTWTEEVVSVGGIPLPMETLFVPAGSISKK